MACAELNNILGWVEQLGEVTEGVEPLTAVIEQSEASRSK